MLMCSLPFCAAKGLGELPADPWSKSRWAGGTCPAKQAMGLRKSRVRGMDASLHPNTAL